MDNQSSPDDFLFKKDVVNDYQREICAKYGLLFRKGVGREVLGDILALCGFPGSAGNIHYGLDPNDPASIGRYNVGIEIARKAGVLEAIGQHILGLNIKRNSVPDKEFRDMVFGKNIPEEV